MKKVFIFALTAGFLTSCKDSDKTTVTTGTSDTAVVVDNAAVTTPVTTPETTTTVVYAPGEGDITMKDGKTMMWTNGTWVATKGDTKLENGMVITKDGVVKQDTRTVYLQEGDAVNKTGNFFDRAGASIDNAWDATKRGVKKAANATGDAVKDAGHAIGTGAKKAGNKVADAVDGDKK